MQTEQHVIVVVDPSLPVQAPVERLAVLADKTKFRPRVTFLVVTDLEAVDGLANHYPAERFNQLSEQMDSIGLASQIYYSWTAAWADSILMLVEELNGTYIMLSHPGSGTTKSMSDNFWRLVRGSRVPIGIFQNTNDLNFNVILGFMSFQETDEDRTGLNRRIGRAGQDIAAIYGAQFHIFNAYGSSEQYPDRGRIVAESGLPNEQIHLSLGGADDAAKEIVAQLQPDMIVIGAKHRTGVKGVLRGRRLSRLLQTIDKDVLIVV